MQGDFPRGLGGKAGRKQTSLRGPRVAVGTSTFPGNRPGTAGSISQWHSGRPQTITAATSSSMLLCHPETSVRGDCSDRCSQGLSEDRSPQCHHPRHRRDRHRQDRHRRDSAAGASDPAASPGPGGSLEAPVCPEAGAASCPEGSFQTGLCHPSCGSCNKV